MPYGNKLGTSICEKLGLPKKKTQHIGFTIPGHEKHICVFFWVSKKSSCTVFCFGFFMVGGGSVFFDLFLHFCFSAGWLDGGTVFFFAFACLFFFYFFFFFFFLGGGGTGQNGLRLTIFLTSAKTAQQESTGCVRMRKHMRTHVRIVPTHSWYTLRYQIRVAGCVCNTQPEKVLRFAGESFS